jgi:hypothetical protein
MLQRFILYISYQFVYDYPFVGNIAEMRYFMHNMGCTGLIQTKIIFARQLLEQLSNKIFQQNAIGYIGACS